MHDSRHIDPLHLMDILHVVAETHAHSQQWQAHLTSDHEGLHFFTKGQAWVRRLHRGADVPVVRHGRGKHDPTQRGCEGSIASLSVTLLGFMADGVCLFVLLHGLTVLFVCVACCLLLVMFVCLYDCFAWLIFRFCYLLCLFVCDVCSWFVCLFVMFAVLICVSLHTFTSDKGSGGGESGQDHWLQKHNKTDPP